MRRRIRRGSRRGRVTDETPPTASFVARLLGRIRGDGHASLRISLLDRLGQRRRAARVALARAGRARLAPLPGRPYYAVVRRGEDEVFRRLEEHFRPNPDVTVIWDRRTSDQCPADAAIRERRMTPVAACQNAAYILVPKTPPQ